ncbi:MAG TPA: M48 family metallopeptidase [Burkholderiales bacterium]|jgi:predicted Zn-dependent protease|nr:M48 family metallopeptidase [Burkholderiales bacterium]
MNRKLIIVAALSAAFAGGCETVDTTKAGAVGVDRQQRMMLSSQEVNAEASKAYAQMMADAQKKGVLDKDAAQVARVKTIIGRLIPATAAFRDDAPKWAWEAHVLTTDEVNAWCMPGGKIAVYTGLINKLQATDDELAAVIGHEIGHALREHTREQMSQQAITQTGIGLAGALLGIGDLGQSLAGAVANVTLQLPKSRGMEKEADDIGVELAARAGYNPQAAVSLWQKMEKVAGGNEPPKFLSTHPPSADRIADLQNQVKKVMPLYQQAKAGGAAAAGK